VVIIGIYGNVPSFLQCHYNKLRVLEASC
jgi:hypothetical protein